MVIFTVIPSLFTNLKPSLWSQLSDRSGRISKIFTNKNNDNIII